MKRREERRKRERESISPALSALLDNISPRDDPSAPWRFLKSFAIKRSVDYNDINNDKNADNNDDNNVLILTGEGLTRLCKELGNNICSNDLLTIARRVPRSQSTLESIEVAELCFAISQALSPANIHERRRNLANAGPIDENAPLIKYYKGDRFLNLLGCNDFKDAESEWKFFLDSVSSPLPMTLRVHRSEEALNYIAQQFLQNDVKISSVLQPLSPLLPLNTGIYGCSHGAYHDSPYTEYICRTLHAASAVSFQEVVSALPVIVADIHSNHTVFDMCAAPGSKTLQILDEMLQNGWKNSSVSQGLVIVNEKDHIKATQILPARLKRYHAPNTICTKCDAVQWPRIFHSNGEKDLTFTEKRFDRIICDVPCSGDGTIRKEPGSASSWSSGYVKSLVPTQKALLRRGLDLLKENGILVYSTCSLNPRENEEIVCAGLELFGDSVELIDVNNILKERGVIINSTGGILSPNIDHLRNVKLPSSYDGRKVLRVFPHRDNTGGFFIAAFRKKSLIDLDIPNTLKEKLNQWTKGKLWAPVGKNDIEWQNIANFYGFNPECNESFYYYNYSNEQKVKEEEKEKEKHETCIRGLVPVYHLNPNGAPCRRIVLVTPAVACMLFHTRPYKGPGVEIVSVGVRAFEAYDGKFLSDASCRWRAVMESASYLAPLMRSRKMIINVEQHPELVKELLTNGFIRLQDHWRVILKQAVLAAAAAAVVVVTTVTSTSETQVNNSTSSFNGMDEVKAFVRADSSLSNILTSIEWNEPPTNEIYNMLSKNVLVGGVLLGLVGGKLTGAKNPWWLSATLSTTKLELAVDVSLRSFGLLAFLGIEKSEETPLTDAVNS